MAMMAGTNASEIANYFTNQTIFITGGTGFIGKILIEKLLRSCGGLRKIYVLIRPKKGKTIDERFEQFFDNVCFDRLKAERADLKHQLHLISGDCEVPGLGLRPADRQLLQKEVTIVIHAAANVRFDQDLRTAANNILKCAREMCRLSQEMSKLRVFNFISTAYSNCPNRHVEEKIYEPPMTADRLHELLETMDDRTLEEITPKLIGKWPNTYTFIKAIAEDLVMTEAKNPTIVRPSIVCGTAVEPLIGWVDNFYGIGGVLVGIFLGVMQSIHAKHDAICNLVPVDYVANIIIASTWDNDVTRSEGDLKIYNFAGSSANLISWGDVNRFMVVPKSFSDLPTVKSLMYPNPVVRESYLMHVLVVSLFQYTPAYLADFVLKCAGKPQIAVSNVTRMLTQMEPLRYFMWNNWQFDSKHSDSLWNRMTETDRKLFNFNMRDLNWSKTCLDLLAGVRVYLLKDPLTPESVKKGRKKYVWLKITRRVAIVFYSSTFLALIYFVYRLLTLFFN